MRRRIYTHNNTFQNCTLNHTDPFHYYGIGCFFVVCFVRNAYDFVYFVYFCCVDKKKKCRKTEELIASGSRRTKGTMLSMLLLMGIPIIVPVPIGGLSQSLVEIQRPGSGNPRSCKTALNTLHASGSKIPPCFHDRRPVVKRDTMGMGAGEGDGRGFVKFGTGGVSGWEGKDSAVLGRDVECGGPFVAVCWVHVCPWPFNRFRGSFWSVSSGCC